MGAILLKSFSAKHDLEKAVAQGERIKRISSILACSHAAFSRYSTTLDGAGTGKSSSRSPSI
jgi:hypothetical protein